MKKYHHNLSDPEQRCQVALQQLELLRATSGMRRPFLKNLWRISTSPLGGGKYAAAAQAKLGHHLAPLVLAQPYLPRPAPRIPAVPARYAILLGNEARTQRPITIHRDTLAHTLLVGATNMGKTRFLYSMTKQIMTQNATLGTDSQQNRIGIHFYDFKGEAPTLLNLYPEATAIFRPDQLPRNILQAKGNARIYFHGLCAVIQRYNNMRPETWTELPGILMRMEKSRQPNDPPPSLVDLEKNLRRLAVAEQRPNLNTAARGIATLIELLGPSARIRAAGHHEKTISIVLYEGLHRRTADQLLALDFISNGTFAETPPTSVRALRRLRILEDAATVLSDDSTSAGDISNSPLVLSFLNNGWLGEAIVASVQIVSNLRDEIINNVKTWVFFACPNPQAAQLAAKILGGEPQLADVIQHLPPRHFVARSEGFEGPVLGVTPTIDTGARPTEKEIEEHMRPQLEDIAKGLTLSPPYEDDAAAPISYLEDDGAELDAPVQDETPPLPDDPGLLADYVKFINTIATHQNLSARELNAALGMSAGKVVKIKAVLVQHGYIIIHKEAGTTGRPRLIVKITPLGLGLLKTWGQSQ